ncbi:putative peptidase [Naviculisporaceae sp. PSN 640]
MKSAIFKLLPLFLAGVSTVTGCLTEEERRGGHIRSSSHASHPHLTNNGTVPVGTGDRFRNGTVPPRGIGSRDFSETLNLTTIPELSTVYNVAEIKSALLALQRTYPSKVEYFELPYKTYHNATMYGAKIRSPFVGIPGPEKGKGQDDNKGYRVLLESGIHARERGGPDYTINFISDLLYADAHSLPALTYGGTSYPLSQVRSVLSQGIVVIPLVNPDGLAYDQATNACWRKNRNPASQVPSSPKFSIGVDLNRNFAPAWNFTQALAPDALNKAAWNSSTEDFAGTAPLSEPETQNIDWVMANFPDLAWFMDLHSMATAVIYGWAHDANQATDPDMNLFNPKYDGTRGSFPKYPFNNRTLPIYREYLSENEWNPAAMAASKVAQGMTYVVNSLTRQYQPMQAVHLYVSSGTSIDHGRWRKAKGLSKNSINGLAVEFGEYNWFSLCPFYPDLEHHRMNMMEVGAGYMEFLLVAEKFDSF